MQHYFILAFIPIWYYLHGGTWTFASYSLSNSQPLVQCLEHWVLSEYWLSVWMNVKLARSARICLSEEQTLTGKAIVGEISTQTKKCNWVTLKTFSTLKFYNESLIYGLHYNFTSGLREMINDNCNWLEQPRRLHQRCNCCCSVPKLCLTLWPHGLQHDRLPCPPRVCSNSCPWWNLDSRNGRKDVLGERNIMNKVSEAELSTIWVGDNCKKLGSSEGEDVLWELETRHSRATIQGGTLKPNYELNSVGKSWVSLRRQVNTMIKAMI